MKISVILPAYNEEDIIEESLFALEKELKASFSGDYEIILVNDGSSDKTQERAEAYVSERIRILKENDHHGKGYAVRKGVLHACGEYIFFTDCDLAYGTHYFLPALREMEENKVDVLVGSRTKEKDGFRGYGFFRTLLSRIYFRFLSLLGGLSVGDTQAGFKGFRGDTAKEVFRVSECDGFAFDYEILLLSKEEKCIIREFPISVVNNRPSSIRFVRDSLRMLRDVLKIKRRLKKKKCKDKHTKKAVL